MDSTTTKKNCHKFLTPGAVRLGGPTGLAKRSGPGGPQSGPQSGPLNEPTSGGGSGESVTGGVTDQPTLRWEKCLGQHLQ